MSRRQKEKKRPGGGASGNANVSADKRDYTTGQISEPTELWAALRGGARRFRIAATYDDAGRFGDTIYLVDNHKRRVFVHPIAALETIAGHLPEIAPLVRGWLALYKAEKSGQVGHA